MIKMIENNTPANKTLGQHPERPVGGVPHVCEVFLSNPQQFPFDIDPEIKLTHYPDESITIG